MDDQPGAERAIAGDNKLAAWGEGGGYEVFWATQKKREQPALFPNNYYANETSVELFKFSFNIKFFI